MMLFSQDDKTNEMGSVCPAKTQISLSLGIRPVWSETLLCAQWEAKEPKFLHVDSEDSVRTWRMPRPIWVSAGRIYHFVDFVVLRLILTLSDFSLLILCLI